MESEKYKQLRIVFMGTPEFAVASLDALVKAGCSIVAVVTAPDKPGGRGLQLQQSAVKKYAVEQHLNVLQPEKLKSPEFLAALKELNADLQIVVAFRMLPELVWNMPPMGTVNLHGSLLPQYRGAAPINWAIINGEDETGVTTFKLKHEIDTGDILLQESFAIEEEETAGDVHDKMKEIGAAVLVKTIKHLADGTLSEIPQAGNLDKGAALKHAPKIHTDTCRINWSQPVEIIFNLVRGLSPYPAAFTVMNEKMMKIFKAKKEIVFPAHTEGDNVTDGKTFLKIACSNGYLHLLEIQMEGKKKMKIEEFLRGYRQSNNQ
ncbi:MAG TPA: methionyl-tRNA formyltransferase [Chitinophagaceae bacterium]|jgi:methionyl-tRNA formyltransferase|nr:methionyl-tRNA formyltransferase [Chitinophagaceae bacterium]